MNVPFTLCNKQPKHLHNSQGFKDIHGNLYAWRYIWEYVCVEERASEAPPAVVRRICGYVGLYVWWRLYAWWRERGRVRERGRGPGRGGGEREKQQPFVKTTRQAQHTNRSTLESRRYDSSIHPTRKRLSARRSRLDSSHVVSLSASRVSY